MNKIYVGLNAVLVIAVGFLFYKVNTLAKDNKDAEEVVTETPKKAEEKKVEITQKGSTPTGKIAFVNIDRLNEESLEIEDLVSEMKRKKSTIEASLESLNMEYQKKVEDYQTSAKAGIAPQSELENKAKYIQSIEKQAANKQLQMEELTAGLNDKNEAFQKNVRSYILKWNNGRYDYILSYSESVPTMLLGNTTLEITNDIISGINSEYKQRKQKK